MNTNNESPTDACRKKNDHNSPNITKLNKRGERKSDGGIGMRVDLEILCDAFLMACRGQKDVKEVEALHAELRRAILSQGIEETQLTKTVLLHGDSLRGKIWKAFMAIDFVDAKHYVELIKQGESVRYSKIRGDSFRTFPLDTQFTDRVKEQTIIRLLNSFVNKYAPKFTYCQGMNSICAPFLYCMPEVDAFFVFCKFVTQKFPLYWVSAHIGAQAGCVLVDRCLAVVDSELFSHLSRHGLTAYVYAFPCVSSLSACVRPFNELLKLWDFLIAFGPHFNILCVVAQIIILRERLLKTEKPKEILDYRKWPHLRSRFIISVAMSIVPNLPADIYEYICRHATDMKVAQELTQRN